VSNGYSGSAGLTAGKLKKRTDPSEERTVKLMVTRLFQVEREEREAFCTSSGNLLFLRYISVAGGHEALGERREGGRRTYRKKSEGGRNAEEFARRTTPFPF